MSNVAFILPILPTEFDWRIGVLNKKPLYACKYYMAKDHWQINQWQSCGSMKEGGHETVPLDAVPRKVLKIAQRAASLIGDGFYGVDLKQKGNHVMVIEINDDPSIDYNVEDGILKDKLYTEIMLHIMQRIKKQKGRVD